MATIHDALQKSEPFPASGRTSLIISTAGCAADTWRLAAASVDLVSNSNDPDEFFSYAMLANKETYDANSNDPKQDAWYRILRSCLIGDPEWFEGTVKRRRMG